MAMLEGKLGLICNVANHRSAGWAVAQSCDREGARVAIGYLGERELAGLQKLTEELSQPPLLIPCDVADDDQVAAMIETVSAEFGRLDFLCHAIAYAKREDLAGRFTDTSRDGFMLAQNISAFSLPQLTQAVEPLMAAGGSIATLSYIGAVRHVPNYNVMGVAKASLEASMRYLAGELGPAGIRVNAVSAGPMRTLAAAAIGDFKAMWKAHADRAPLRRNTTQEEVGDATAFLFSDLARGITGNVLYVDSGYSVVI